MEEEEEEAEEEEEDKLHTWSRRDWQFLSPMVRVRRCRAATHPLQRERGSECVRRCRAATHPPTHVY